MTVEWEAPSRLDMLKHQYMRNLVAYIEWKFPNVELIGPSSTRADLISNIESAINGYLDYLPTFSLVSPTLDKVLYDLQDWVDETAPTKTQFFYCYSPSLEQISDGRIKFSWLIYWR
jgi:hypothetical protein